MIAEQLRRDRGVGADSKEAIVATGGEGGDELPQPSGEWRWAAHDALRELRQSIGSVWLEREEVHDLRDRGTGRTHPINARGVRALGMPVLDFGKKHWMHVVCTLEGVTLLWRRVPTAPELTGEGCRLRAVRPSWPSVPINPHPMLRPHFIILGGFLGSGKTTAIQRLGEHLTSQGIRVGMITNDQGNDLVDTQLLRNCGFATQEVAGGCFCCRFDRLMDAARFLKSDVGPEVLVAEAVGSCTDLSATVTYPMRRLFGDSYTVAPLSVMVDPIRARRVMGLDAGEGFAGDVEYIYRKQLEEADLIVMNKVDLLSDARINELGTTLSEAFPRAEVMAVSSRDGLQLGAWFDRILYSAQRPRASIDVDYDVYATGEARLGWVNASLVALGAASFDGPALLLALARELQRQLVAAGAVIAHLKMTLAAGQGDASNVASIQLVGNDVEPTPGRSLDGPMTEGWVVVNLRAQASYRFLESALRLAAEKVGGPASAVSLSIALVQAFSPSRPTPTHRETITPG